MTFAALRGSFLALIALFVFAAGPAAAKVVLERGNNSEPDTLDPHKASGQWENNIISDLYVGLMTFNAKGEPVYGAAESHTVSEDGLVYTFTIREGHKWSDGTPVTPDDFIFSFQRINDPATAAQYASLTYPLKNAQAINEGRAPKESIGAKALDTRTLEITLEHPAPYFLQLLTHYTMYPVPKHQIESLGESEWIKAGVMASNGAYKLAEWIPNDRVRLVKNPYFYEADDVQIDEVNYYPINDVEAAMKRFRAGELDINNNLPIPQLDWLKANLPEETRIYPFILTQYIVFNMTKPPFNDLRVRQAFALALDREFITERIMRTGQIPAYALVPPGILNYPGTASVIGKGMDAEARRAKARALLAEAGYGPDNPLTTTLIHPSNLDTKRVAVALQDMWRQIGAQVQIQAGESKNHYNNLQTQNFELGWAGWIADYNDARNYLFLAETRSGQMNYSKYTNPAFDNAIIEADKILDLGQRGQMLVAAEQMLLDDVAMAPVYYGTSRNLVQTYVKGWEDNVVDVHRTRFMRIEGAKIPPVAKEEQSAAPSSTSVSSEDGVPQQSWWDWFWGLVCSWTGLACPASG